MMKTTNKLIALNPFAVIKETKVTAKGLDLSDGLTTNMLISTSVAISSESYNVGDILFFKAETAKLPQYRMFYKVNEIQFILLQEDLVVAVQRNIT